MPACRSGRPAAALDAPGNLQYCECAHAVIATCALDEPATQALLLAAAKEFGQ
jgi:hypothetical protein